MNYRFSGKILEVDLTGGQTKTITVSNEMMRKYMGGKSPITKGFGMSESGKPRTETLKKLDL